MTKHTPGPWACTSTSNHAHDYRLTRPGGEPLPVYAPCNDHSEQRANARLIRTAPDLLAIAERWAALDGGAWNVERLAREKAELLSDTRAAIAKAKGEGA